MRHVDCQSRASFELTREVPMDPSDSPQVFSEASGPAPVCCRSSVRDAAARVRIVATDDGRQWVVRELPSSPSEWCTYGSLLFISDRAIRRVRDYPADWFDRPDADLIAVSMRR